jgi:hypothetical protein
MAISSFPFPVRPLRCGLEAILPDASEAEDAGKTDRGARRSSKHSCLRMAGFGISPDSVGQYKIRTLERIDRGEYRLVRLSPPKNQGLLDWLLACPEKGFFVPIES